MRIKVDAHAVWSELLLVAMVFGTSITLDNDGFVRHCNETETYKGANPQNETWDFTYNGDGQLLTMLRSEGGNERTTVKYSNGNIVEVNTVSAGEPDENGTVQ